MINRRFLVDYTMKDSRMCSFKWWHDYCCRWYILKKDRAKVMKELKAESKDIFLLKVKLRVKSGESKAESERYLLIGNKEYRHKQRIELIYGGQIYE